MLHVVAGVLENPEGLVLLAQRPAGKAMAGAWEFPGGKLLPGEGRFDGLVRELREELGILVSGARPLIRYRHRYAEFEVDLDVWRIERWTGNPRGLEGQALEWESPNRLLELGLLPADAAAACAIRLPAICTVTPANAARPESPFLDQIEQVGATHPGALLCLRRPDLDATALLELAAGAACRLEGTGTRLMLHGAPSELMSALAKMPRSMAPRLEEAVAGLHAPGRWLSASLARPVPPHLLFGVSCHTVRELQDAAEAGADYAFLGPVKPTMTHPGEPGMGWPAFAALVEALPLPVYAIGGLGPEDLCAAWDAGAQGIAGIRGLWPVKASPG
jgi:8-oxo-dGTP diphosphatase